MRLKLINENSAIHTGVLLAVARRRLCDHRLTKIVLVESEKKSEKQENHYNREHVQ